MFKVLIVDDERLARESIASLVDWKQNGFELLGTASNGEEALEHFRREQADIVITDIRMPIMDGLQLIELLREESPRTEYVVLSGYGDYEYTSVAMANGVKHYLLKPFNEVDILNVLRAVAAELTQKIGQQSFFERLQHDFKKVLPHVKDQLLRDIALTGIYNKQDCDYFMELFMIEQQKFKLVLFAFDEETEYVHKFALKNIAEEVFQSEGVYLTTIVRDQVLLLVSSVDFEHILDRVKQVQHVYRLYYKMELFVAVSDEGGFLNIRSMYENAKHCLSFGGRFKEGYVVTPQDVMVSDTSLPVDRPDLSERLAVAVRIGNSEEVEKVLKDASNSFETSFFNMKEAKKFCLDLFLIAIRQAEEEYDEWVKKIPVFYEMPSLHASFMYLQEACMELASRNSGLTAKKQNDLIDEVIRIIKENLSNSELSLKWIANELLYVNVDYLGRLFTKKTGSKFSNYLLQLRMESAKRYMEQALELKVYDIAAMTGYPEDAQYFSKVFKRYTGMTPKEYMVSAKQANK